MIRSTASDGKDDMDILDHLGSTEVRASASRPLDANATLDSRFRSGSHIGHGTSRMGKWDSQICASEHARLRDVFMQLDRDGKGYITEETLSSLIHTQNPTSGVTREKMFNMIKDLNSLCGIEDTGRPSSPGKRAGRISVVSMRPSGLPEIGMTFEVYMELMKRKDLTVWAGELVTEMTFLQEALTEAGANQMVAHLMNLRTEDLQTGQNRFAWHIKSKFIEPVVSVLIFCNAIFIGLGTDMEWVGYGYFEIGFTTVFAAELGAKVVALGPTMYFLGSDWQWNLFDFCVVFLAIADSSLLLFIGSRNVPGMSAIRVLRLARFVRLVRLFRNFKELSLMIGGLVSGMRTLFWAMVLLLVSVYVLGVMATQTVGREKEARIPFQEDLFSTVPKSMFTVFRCLANDCVNKDGRPLLAQLQHSFGWLFVLVYALAFILLTFGLFNLIAAIFVESTILNAKTNDQKIAAARHREDVRVAKKLKKLIHKFMNSTTLQNFQNSDYSVHDEITATATVLNRVQFESIIEEPDVQQLLDELDLSSSDRGGLFDVLDADGDGCIAMDELLRGMLQVRGDARKSDVVATRLAVRTIQNRIKDFEEQTLKSQSEVWESLLLMKGELAKIKAKVASPVAIDARPTLSDGVRVSLSPTQSAPPAPIHRTLHL